MQKLAGMFSGRAIPAWIVLMWTVLAWGSTAQFTFLTGEAITGWLDRHAWAGFLLASGLFLIGIFWSNIREKLPTLPATAHQRLGDIEKSHKELTRCLDEHKKKLETVPSTVTDLVERVAELEDGNKGLASLDAVQSVQIGLDEHRHRVTELESKLNTLTHLPSVVNQISRDWNEDKGEIKNAIGTLGKRLNDLKHRSHGPQLQLSYERDFRIENRGDADAHDIVVDAIETANYLLETESIPLINRSNTPATLKMISERKSDHSRFQGPHPFLQDAGGATGKINITFLVSWKDPWGTPYARTIRITALWLAFKSLGYEPSIMHEPIRIMPETVQHSDQA